MSLYGAPQAFGGPSGVMRGLHTCLGCGWTGPAENAPFHDCAGPGSDGEREGSGLCIYPDPEDDWEPCTHQCDEECEPCLHEHCPNCGGCGCPGYCDDYQTYNLRQEETGGHAGGAQ